MGFLNLNSERKFLPRLDMDLRAGRFFAVERTQNAAGEWESEKVEVEKPRFVADLANCEIGWTAFIDKRPDSVMRHCADGMPPQPTPEHKAAFGINVKMIGGDFDGSLRKFGKQGLTIGRAFDDLVDAWQKLPEATDPTKCPVIAVTGTTPVKAGQSTNYAPKWGIVEFVDRPAEFDDHVPARRDLAAEKAAEEATQAAVAADDVEFL
jgi:hypothetical protein